jgi:hypothetical protein
MLNYSTTREISDAGPGTDASIAQSFNWWQLHNRKQTCKIEMSKRLKSDEDQYFQKAEATSIQQLRMYLYCLRYYLVVLPMRVNVYFLNTPNQTKK